MKQTGLSSLFHSNLHSPFVLLFLQQWEVERSALQTAPHLHGCACKTEWHRSDRFKRKLGAINECWLVFLLQRKCHLEKVVVKWAHSIHIINIENLLWTYILLLKPLKQPQCKAQVLVWKNWKHTCTTERPFAWLLMKPWRKQLSFRNEVHGRMPSFNNSIPYKFSAAVELPRLKQHMQTTHAPR